MSKLYEVQEVADLLKVNPITVRGWLRAGTIKGRKVGGKWFIAESELDYLKQEDQPKRIDFVDEDWRTAIKTLRALKKFLVSSWETEKRSCAKFNELDNGEVKIERYEAEEPYAVDINAFFSVDLEDEDAKLVRDFFSN